MSDKVNNHVFHNYATFSFPPQGIIRGINWGGLAAFMAVREPKSQGHRIPEPTQKVVKKFRESEPTQNGRKIFR